MFSTVKDQLAREDRFVDLDRGCQILGESDLRVAAGSTSATVVRTCTIGGTHATCRLVDAVPPYFDPFKDGSGSVKVTTTDTGVKFTVVSSDYFAASGSTINFEAISRKSGEIDLVQTGRAHGADFAITIGVNLGAGQIAWTQQASNLRRLLSQ